MKKIDIFYIDPSATDTQKAAICKSLQAVYGVNVKYSANLQKGHVNVDLRANYNWYWLEPSDGWKMQRNQSNLTEYEKIVKRNPL